MDDSRVTCCHGSTSRLKAASFTHASFWRANTRRRFVSFAHFFLYLKLFYYIKGPKSKKCCGLMCIYLVFMSHVRIWRRGRASSNSITSITTWQRRRRRRRLISPDSLQIIILPGERLFIDVLFLSPPGATALITCQSAARRR